MTEVLAGAARSTRAALRTTSARDLVDANLVTSRRTPSGSRCRVRAFHRSARSPFGAVTHRPCWLRTCGLTVIEPAVLRLVLGRAI